MGLSFPGRFSLGGKKRGGLRPRFVYMAAVRHFLSPDQVRELDAEIREVLTDLGTEGSRHDEAAAATAGD
jgi:hypothetical protein